MRIIPTAAMAAILILSTPTFAQNSSQAATAATASAAQPSKAAAEEKKVCKRLETSGTRMAERVCLTKDEWKRVEQQMGN